MFFNISTPFPSYQCVSSNRTPRQTLIKFEIVATNRTDFEASFDHIKF